MKWSERYSTGVETLDRQHQMLFQMSEDYRTALDEGKGDRTYGLLLANLELFARLHFGAEEQCMARHDCPAAKVNREAHLQFLEQVAGFRQRFEQARFDRDEAYRLVSFLDDWLANHIGRIDIQLKPCLDRPLAPD